MVSVHWNGREAACAWGVALATSVLFWWDAWSDWDRIAPWDWLQFQHHWEAAYATVMRDGEFPTWNPYQCGGVTLFGDPQAQVYSPWFLLALALGVTLAMKTFLTFHTAVGLWGFYLVLRRAGELGRPSAALGASLWGLSGFFVWHGSLGHMAFLPFYYLPLLWWFWRRALQDGSLVAFWAFLGLVSLCALEGGVYPIPFFALFFGVDLLLLWVWDPQVRSRGLARVLGILLVMGAGVCALTLIRWVPILDTLARFPRPTHGSDALSLGEFWGLWTQVRTGDTPVPGHEYRWSEYTAYVGPLGVALCLLGCVSAWRRRGWLLVGVLIFSALAMGAFAWWAPWSLLHRIPPFSSLRVPSRFSVLAAFGVAWLAAEGLQWLVLWAKRCGAHVRFRGVAPWALVVLVVGYGMIAHYRPRHAWWIAAQPELHDSTTYYYLPDSRFTELARFPRWGVGHRICYSGMNTATAPGVWAGAVSQVRVPRGNRVLMEQRTGNRFVFRVRMAAPGSVVINQTWDPDWTSSLGRLSRDSGGRLALELPKGEHVVRLQHSPRRLGWVVGGQLFALLLWGVVGAWFLSRYLRRRVALRAFPMGVEGGTGTGQRDRARPRP